MRSFPTPTPVRTNPMMPEKKSPDKINHPKPIPGVRMAVPATFRRGGRVRRTGVAKIHKGERVVGAAGVLGKGIKAKKRLKEAQKKIKKAAKAKE